MSFDRLAPHYRWMEAVLAGGTLQRARTSWLHHVPPPRRALLVGEGNGRFLAPALVAWPDAEFVCVDASPAMLAQACRGLGSAAAARVTWVHATLPGWEPEARGFDSVATHFFLDCFPATILAEVVRTLSRAAADEATWLLTDFVVPTRGLARWRARAIVALMYGFFRPVARIPARRLVPPEPFLVGEGFACCRSRGFEWGLVRSDLWVRAVGRDQRRRSVGLLSMPTKR